MTDRSKSVLKWWLVIAFAITLALTAIGEFGSLDKRVTTVETTLQNHMDEQDRQRQEDRQDLQYIRERIDEALSQKRK